MLAQKLVKPTSMDLWVANADGTEAHQVTYLPGASFGPYFDPHAGASGKRIIFTSYENDGPGNTMLIRPDGSGLTQLTHYDRHVGAGGAAYAPNGRWIVYRRQNNATGRCAIWKMRPDGSDRTHIRAFGVCFGGLDWGPQPT